MTAQLFFSPDFMASLIIAPVIILIVIVTITVTASFVRHKSQYSSYGYCTEQVCGSGNLIYYTYVYYIYDDYLVTHYRRMT